MAWAEWVESLTQPVVRRVMQVLGVGTASFAAVRTGFDSVVDTLSAAAGGVAVPVANILGLAGFWDAMAITLGGVSGWLSYKALTWTLIRANGGST